MGDEKVSESVRDAESEREKGRGRGRDTHLSSSSAALLVKKSMKCGDSTCA